MAHVRLLCTFQLRQVLYDEDSLIVLRSGEVGNVYDGKAGEGALTPVYTRVPHVIGKRLSST